MKVTLQPRIDVYSLTYIKTQTHTSTKERRDGHDSIFLYQHDVKSRVDTFLVSANLTAFEHTHAQTLQL